MNSNIEAFKPETVPIYLSYLERKEIVEILDRRANELATFRRDLETHTKEKFNGFPGSVELAISREVD